MIQFWQIFAAAALALATAAFLFFAMLSVRKQRMDAYRQRRDEHNFQLKLEPEREYLDERIRELYDSYASTAAQVAKLNEIVEYSLSSNPTLPSAKNSFQRSLKIAESSSFLKGIGINTSDISETNGIVFYLTSFSVQYENDFRTVRETCGELGLSVFRASEQRAQEQILTAIVRSIISSEFVIANISGRNPNVYYELAIAQMLEKRVILISSARETMEFDVKNQQILLYHGQNDLKILLTQAIARIGLSPV